MRIVLADDSLLVRQGLIRLLENQQHQISASVADLAGLDQAVHATDPDLVVVDIRMPPTFRDEGLRAALKLATSHPRLGVLVLSAYTEVAYAQQLLKERTAGRGYLLKDSVLHPRILADAITRVSVGECVIDPHLVDALLSAPGIRPRIQTLSNREVDVLRCMAEGLSDRGIAERLCVTPRTVATHVGHIFQRLDIPAGPTDNRRVQAVLTYLSTPP